MKKTILLIEDDAVIRENTAEILRFANYTVHTAANGKTGLEKIMEIHPDIIICDIMMPRLDGYGVLKILSKNPEYEHIPFVFLSSKSGVTDRRKAMELGADDFLVKPFEESDLLTVIETRIAKSKKNRNRIPQKNLPESTPHPYDEVHTLKELIHQLFDRKIFDYKKGETLYCEGNSSNHIYLIKEGVIKTFKSTESGKEFITGLYIKEQFLGYTSSFGNFPHNESAEALCDVKL